MREMRPMVVAKSPDHKSSVEVVKAIAKLWAEADPEKKQQLQEEYKKDQVTYNLFRKTNLYYTIRFVCVRR